MCINCRTNTHMQEQACVYMNIGCTRKNMSTHRRVFFDIYKVFSTKTQPKHVPTPFKVSGFHLNPFHSKTQAFKSLKTYQNRKSKEKLENEKNKNSPIRPCALKKILWSIGQGRSRNQPYRFIPAGKIEGISGEDVGTLLGLGCH